MPDPTEPAYGMLVVSAAALVLVALLVISVKVRALTGRRFGVRVYDFGADLELPPTLHSRGYQFALYLSMKSRPCRSAEARLNARAAPH